MKIFKGLNEKFIVHNFYVNVPLNIGNYVIFIYIKQANSLSTVTSH